MSQPATRPTASVVQKPPQHNNPASSPALHSHKRSSITRQNGQQPAAPRFVMPLAAALVALVATALGLRRVRGGSKAAAAVHGNSAQAGAVTGQRTKKALKKKASAAGQEPSTDAAPAVAGSTGARKAKKAKQDDVVAQGAWRESWRVSWLSCAACTVPAAAWHGSFQSYCKLGCLSQT